MDELDVRVKIITFDDDFLAKAYVEDAKIPWPLLMDAKMEVYSRYGLKRANWWTLYNPVSIAGYLWLMIRGTRPGTPGKDWNQLGGDVLIDPEGIVRAHYTSSNPHDRPNIDSFLNIIP